MENPCINCDGDCPLEGCTPWMAYNQSYDYFVEQIELESYV